MSKMKRLTSILLVAIMVLTYIPTNVIATDIIESGTCGSDITWTFDKEGVLTISGIGEMTDFDDDNRPWESCEDEICTVIMKDGITSIGRHAFSDCELLTDIVIPKSITTIGDYAFSWCAELTSANIPDSVTTIGDYAFENCDSLISIKIPNSVITIGKDAFSSCSDLISIEIPDSVTTIGDYAFYDCNSLTSIKIPNSVTTIGGHTFYSCERLISIEIPNSVTTIGDYAFGGCEGLTDIEIPNSVTTIGNNVFSSCSSLISIEIPNSVTMMGNYVFSFCDSLTSVELSDSLTTIMYGLFYYCTNLTSVEIPNSVTTIGKATFNGCYSLESIEIPDSVTTIEDYAFYLCEKLKKVIIPNSVKYIGSSAFAWCGALLDVEYLGNEAEWEKISIEEGNEDLTTTNIHYGEKTHTEHTYGDWVVYLEPSCFEDGYRERFCTECGESESELIPQLEKHQWSDWEKYEEEGIMTRTCILCGNVDTKKYQPQPDGLGPSMSIRYNKHAYKKGDVATVEIVAYNVAFNVVGFALNYGENVSLVGKNGIETNVIEDILRYPNRYKDGSGVFEDSRSEIKDKNIISVLYVEPKATDVEDGVVRVHEKGYVIAEICFVMLSDGLPDLKFTTVNNDTDFSNKSVIFANGGQSETDVLTSIEYADSGDCAHPDVVILEAVNETCTTNGFTEGMVCKDCGEIIVTQTEVLAKGHTETLINVKEATEKEEGYTGDRVCSVCEEVLERGRVIPVIASKSNIVTDNFFSLKDGSDTYYYHIPEIKMEDDKANAVNEKINSTLYESYLRAKQDVDEGNGTVLYRISYDCAQNGNIFSLITQERSFRVNSFGVYNISVNTGNEVSAKDVLALFDISESDFYQELKKSVETFYRNEYFLSEDEEDDMLTDTLEEANIKQSRPFITADGKLGAVIHVYPRAGASDNEFAIYALTGEKAELGDESYVKADFEIKSVQPVKLYTVSYDANGGNNAPSAQTKKSGEDLALSEQKPEREGYKFLGWAESKNATTAEYQPLDNYSKDEDATLYAVWQKEISVESQIVVESKEVGTDKEFEVQVSIKNNPGVGFMVLVPQIPEGLTLKEVKAGNLFKVETDKNYIFEADSDVTTDGVIATLVFEAVSTEGEYEIGFKFGEASNYAEESVEFKTVNGKVTVRKESQQEYILGDVDEDGTVSAKDATQILRYINGKSSVFTTNGADTALIEKIADVDDDESVTAKDATQILRHINGKTSVLGNK